MTDHYAAARECLTTAFDYGGHGAEEARQNLMAAQVWATLALADAAGDRRRHDVECDFAGPRPTITVLCGSTRFADAFRDANLQLTLRGHIVLTIGCDTKTEDELHSDPAEIVRIKARLDELHKRKIDLADEVLVLDVDGYIGDSTRGEVAYARARHKHVRFLSDRSRPAGEAAPA